jgi:hypothetical protein
MTNVILERDDVTRISNPTLAVIHDHLRLAEQELGAPEVTLEFGPRVRGQPVLMMMALFENGVPAVGWNVMFKRWRSNAPSISLSKNSTNNGYNSRIRCGCPISIRSDCEISDATAIDSAIKYFIEHGEAHPELQWIGDEEAIRYEE